MRRGPLSRDATSLGDNMNAVSIGGAATITDAESGEVKAEEEDEDITISSCWESVSLKR